MLKYKAILLLLIFSACKDNSIQNTCADPIGSEDKSLSNESLICFKDGFNACFQIDYSPSLKQIRFVTISGGGQATIADIGAANCLGEITEKPSSGFSPTVLERSIRIIRLSHSYGVKWKEK